jgi:lactate dehydrogenase-like 2-hydroxyacid dehydrogenase
MLEQRRDEERILRIGIVGAGRIGGNAGKLFAGAGHEVFFSGSPEPDRLEQLAVGFTPVDLGGWAEEPILEVGGAVSGLGYSGEDAE